MRLTPRELAYLRRAADGLTYAQTAAVEYVSVGTVRTTLSSVCQKLDAHNRTHAVAIAYRRGLLGDGPETGYSPVRVPENTGEHPGGSDTEDLKPHPAPCRWPVATCSWDHR